MSWSASGLRPTNIIVETAYRHRRRRGHACGRNPDRGIRRDRRARAGWADAGIELAWQKFVGVEYDAPGHGLKAPIIMDATVDQTRLSFRLQSAVQCDRLLVEDTYYRTAPRSIPPQSPKGSRTMSQHRDGPGSHSVRSRVLPIVLGGKTDLFWPVTTRSALGLKGGFFHPTTGYSLPQAAGNAIALGKLPTLALNR